MEEAKKVNLHKYADEAVSLSNSLHQAIGTLLLSGSIVERDSEVK